MIDLAEFSETEPVSIGSISQRQGISERYLEQLMAKLKKAGLVREYPWCGRRLCHTWRFGQYFRRGHPTCVRGKPGSRDVCGVP